MQALGCSSLNHAIFVLFQGQSAKLGFLPSLWYGCRQPQHPLVHLQPIIRCYCCSVPLYLSHRGAAPDGCWFAEMQCMLISGPRQRLFAGNTSAVGHWICQCHYIVLCNEFTIHRHVSLGFFSGKSFIGSVRTWFTHVIMIIPPGEVRRSCQHRCSQSTTNCSLKNGTSIFALTSSIVSVYVASKKQ